MAKSTKMPEYKIVIIHLKNRMTNAGQMQKILSEYGCSIKTRIGFHEASKEFCDINGLIIVHMLDKEKELVAKLKKIKGIEVTAHNYK